MSRVFVSCGQHSKEERELAQRICRLLESRGFEAYLAIDVQTILDINGGIIRELKNCDCYLFVNFRRERIGEVGDKDEFRGSLFSNQELAIAYSLGFQNMLIINQEGVASEGMLRYIGVNTEKFSDYRDCLEVVERALDRAAWMPSYSRRLTAANLHFHESLIRYGQLSGWFLYLDIHNGRPDIAALETTAKLFGYRQSGQSYQPSSNSSPLKATGRRGFSHTIFPQSHEAFDLLCIAPDEPPLMFSSRPASSYFGTLPPSTYETHPDAPTSQRGVRVYLNCALDVDPLPSLPITAGQWTFLYEFFAIDFSVLRVEIEVIVPDVFSQHQAPNGRLISQTLA